MAERLALARVAQGLIGRTQQWPQLGRYEAVRPLGKGSFGSVLLGRDPELDREVAIKIVSLPHGDTTAARQRVTREARALAALTHPGVVSVYDFGLVDDAACRDEHGEPGALYIVMEYLRGSSLRAWLTEGPSPSQAEILAVFDRIAAGLAAVHATGLVHRDVKPDNVVLTADGIPKLIDFGLVRENQPYPAPSSEIDDTEPMEPLEPLNAADGSARVGRVDPPELTPPHGTAAGVVIGTPQYMAPEQHDGSDVTPACDQFALAASLFEALAERMPFSGRDLAELLRRKVERRRPAPRRPIPPAILEVIDRALSPDPTERFETVEHFRQALARAAAPRRRSRWLTATIAVAVLAPTAALVALRQPDPGDGPPCPEGPLFSDLSERFTAAHSDGRDNLGDNHGDNLGTWANLAEALEAYDESWAGARAEVCDRSPDSDVGTQHRRVACLDHAAVVARTWLDGFVPQGRMTMMDARDRVSGLPDPGACVRLQDDLQGLSAELRAQIGSLERELALLEGKLRVDVTRETVEAAERVVERARATKHLPLIAHALDVTGRLQLDLGRSVAADQTLTEAVWASLAADRPSRAALVMPRLLHARDQAAGPEDFDDLLPLAERVLREADAPPTLRARVDAMIGFNLLGRSRFADAEAKLRSVKAALEQADATISTDYGETLNGLAAVMRNQGRLDEALALAERALEVLTDADGPTAPTTALAHERVGSIHHVRGETAEAARYYETSIELIADRYGPEHPDLAWPRLILAMLWAEDGRADEAAKVADWALRTAEASNGEHTEMLAVMTFNRSIIAEKRGNLDRALALARRSRGIHARLAGPHSLDVADADRRIGRLLSVEGEHDEALGVLEGARASFDNHGREVDAAECRWLMAQAYDGLGRSEPARRHAQAALAALPADAEERAEVSAFLQR